MNSHMRRKLSAMRLAPAAVFLCVHTSVHAQSWPRYGVEAMEVPGAAGVIGEAIAENGDCVGTFWAQVPDGNQTVFVNRGFMVDGNNDLRVFDGFGDFLAVRAFGINNVGLVVGAANPGGGMQPAILTPNQLPALLGTLGGPNGRAQAVNDSGEIVGRARTAAGEEHAFWRDPATGLMVDLGTLGGASSTANAVNAGGSIVGSALDTLGRPRAFLAPGARAAMEDLNGVLPPGSGWELTEAVAISDAGEVAGNGLLNGAARAFMLTPQENGWVIRELPPLPGDNESRASAVNSSGAAVGYSRLVVGDVTYEPYATLWIGERVIRIEDRLVNYDLGVFNLNDAMDITDGGVIVTLVAGSSTFRLTPFCHADIDLDGRLTAADFASFHSTWRAGDPDADFDADGDLDFADYSAFRAAWLGQTGCP